ncbi:hypothetical protein HDU97_008013 [Phlyctochytrium planicorne]|nr:hypothetical protein HDU97_008013 [Phlyctochytrium planicorne]
MSRGLNDNEVAAEMNKMVSFIKQEALEKAREIKVKADEEFNIEKAKLVRQETIAIEAFYQKKIKQAEVARKIAHSNHVNKNRLRLLQARQQILDELFAEARNKLLTISSDPSKYQALLKDLLLQAFYQLMEEKIVIQCRKADHAIVQSALEEAKTAYTKALNKPLKAEIDSSNALPEKSAGGVVVSAFEGRIRVSNTLESRLDILGDAPASWSAAIVRPYKDKSFADLVNSYAVFRLCAFPALVDWTPWMLDVSSKLRLKPVMDFVVKRTFFKHFCGGENITEVLPTMAAFKSRGIGSILDLAMEADLDAGSAAGVAAKDLAAKVASQMKDSVNIASEQSDSFIAVKVTAFVPPAVLLRWSNCLRDLQAGFNKLDTDKDGKITSKEFLDLCSTYPNVPSKLVSELTITIQDADKLISWTSLMDAFSITNKNTRGLLQKNQNNPIPELEHATAEDFLTADLTLAELESLFVHARSKNVRVMIDAEQTYFQPAIDDIAIAFSRKLNPKLETTGGRAVIFNTYQMYLKAGKSRLEEDLARADRGGYTFGAKIVRGAYMVSERERAEEFNYADPIQTDIASTHRAYNSAIELMVSRIGKAQREKVPSLPLSFVVASHNRDSILKTIAALKKDNVQTSKGEVAFAQLMGMQDSTSYALAVNGYKCYKYIPYGPVEVTIPYLLRRAQENSSLLGGVAEDKQNISDEIMRRLGKSAKIDNRAGPSVASTA